MNNFNKLLDNNKKWSDKMLKQDPHYFEKHLNDQKPTYLWIGCSDSRISAETVMGLKPGEIFVHRNVANQVPLADINVLSVIQYAVEVLEVSDIIVAGHYDCGGVRAAFQKKDFGCMESWLAHIREIKIRLKDHLKGTEEENLNTLIDLNVKSQVYAIAKIPCVQRAWVTGKQLRVHGLVYQMDNGLFKDLGLTLSRLDMVPEEFWIYDNKLQKHLQEAFEKIFRITKMVPQVSAKTQQSVQESWTI